MLACLVIHPSVSWVYIHGSERGAGETDPSIALWQFVLDGVYPSHDTAENRDDDLDALGRLTPEPQSGLR
jgi:hypothetical protein